jgi:NAD+ diphosphatase
LNRSAFFFQGNCLLLPANIPDSQIAGGVPLDLSEEFENPELFEIPVIEHAVSEAAAESAAPIACVSISPECSLTPLWRAVPVRQGLSLLGGGMVEGKGTAGRLLRAFHVVQWRRESQFCGSCGTRNNDSPGELARLCPACGRQEFPRISPAVIAIIINGEGKALLAHNKKFLNGMYSLIAGFNEAGESLEATVARETREEVNIEVRDIRYVASQPWPFPNSLMLGFSARYVSGTIRPDGVEIEDAQWFGRDALPKLPGPGSVSRYLIGRWLEGTL